MLDSITQRYIRGMTPENAIKRDVKQFMGDRDLDYTPEPLDFARLAAILYQRDVARTVKCKTAQQLLDGDHTELYIRVSCLHLCSTPLSRLTQVTAAY